MNTNESKTTRSRVFWLAAGLVLLASIIVRLIGLGRANLWTDEVDTFYMAQQPVAKILRDKHAVDAVVMPEPPLAALVVKPFVPAIKLNADSDLTPRQRFLFRLPAMLAGIASVLLVMLFALRLGHRRVALWAGALLGLSYCAVYYSREGRSYSWVVLLTLVAGYGLYRLANRPQGKWIGPIVLALTLGLYTHYFIAFMGVAASCFIIVFALWQKREGWVYLNRFIWCALASIVLVLLLYAPWLPAFFRVAFLGMEGRHGYQDAASAAPVAALGFNLEYFRALIGRWTVGRDGNTLPVIMLAAIGVATLWRRDRAAAMWLTIWLLLPWLLVMFIPGSSMTHVRYLLFGMPALLLLLAVGVDEVYLRLCQLVKTPAGTYVALAATIFLIFLLLLPSLLGMPELFGENAKCLGDTDGPLCLRFVD